MSELSNESLLEGAECARLTPEEADRLFFQINSSIPDQNFKRYQKDRSRRSCHSHVSKLPSLKAVPRICAPTPRIYRIWNLGRYNSLSTQKNVTIRQKCNK